MRGKRPTTGAGLGQRRNIPAYAGKTSFTRKSKSACEEHPRVCGENLKESVRVDHRKGTSPRMRGKL